MAHQFPTRLSSLHDARWIAALAGAGCLWLAAASSTAHAQQPAVRGAEPAGNPCGLIYTRHYGPYDYRTQRGALAIVEEFHFDARVEAGIRGINGHIAGDINYTLKASPNHHRALVTLVNVTTRARSDRLPGMEWPMECYFDRAIRFRPDDSVVRSLYAQWLFQRKRPADAVKQLDAAIGMSADNPFSQFNVGLIFLQNGMLDRALEQAHRAQAMGFPRTELVDGLKSRGAWREPAPAQAASAPAAAGSQPR